ncbi:MAG: M23 family metallopeptidase [Candidatus Limnocylindrales bacterium]
MFRARRAIPRVELTWRLLTPLLAVALVLSTGALAPDPVEAGGASVVSSVRAKQLAAESAMRRADQQIERLQKQRGNHRKLLKAAKKKLAKAIDRRRAADDRADKAATRLHGLQLTLTRETRVRPNPAGTQGIDKPKLRVRVTKLQRKVRGLEASLRKAERKEAKVRALKQSRVKKPARARLAARKRERERAESKLSVAIYQMTALSRDRAGRFGTASVRRFVKPVKGKLSQAYGCTGYGTNPRRGSCKHFHDGVDIVAGVGTKVKASADGYVAYVGWSPWDRGARAYVVIIGHAGGYESVYAHLQPRRKVRAGQKVRRGAVIGTIGMTGLTTGAHVHWEVRRHGVNVDPLKAGR